MKSFTRENVADEFGDHYSTLNKDANCCKDLARTEGPKNRDDEAKITFITKTYLTYKNGTDLQTNDFPQIDGLATHQSFM